MRRILLLLAASVAMLVLVSSAAADQSYTDPTGDGKVGTDITNLTVRNDAAGLIQFQVASANPIVANHAIAIFINADRNLNTGSSSGDEYWMYGGPAVGIGFFAWNGSQFVQSRPPSFLVGAAAANVTEFRINRADIGNVSTFDFVAVSISLDPPNLNFWDFAPDTGAYTYTLAGSTPPPPTTTTPPPPPTPTMALGKAAAKVPGVHAGKPFAISSAVVTSGAGIRVTCTARVGGLKLHPRGSYSGGRAWCRGTAPAGSAGKKLTGSITASAGGARDTETFSVLVRR